MLLAVFTGVCQNQIDYKADRIKFVKDYKGGAKRLIGNVRFATQDGMVMTCDSSYFLDNNNIEAYSNIVIRQGDSLTITGKNAHYNGNTKLGIIDGNVTCTERDMILITPTLGFDSRNKIASYTQGGTITSKENTLTSRHGYYHSPTKTVSFKYDVKLLNPEYTITADTLKYITSSKTAVFLGPTNIVSKKDNLYCEKGWYNTQEQVANLTKKGVIHSDKNILRADSIHYDKKKEWGEAFGNVSIVDTAEKIIISGNHSFNNQQKGITWITGNTLLIKPMNKDSMFASADTIWAFQRKATLKRDSSNAKKNDSTIVKAYHNVKIFKKDVQGIADTMIYSAYDSTLTLYHLPVMWHEENQLSGKKILVYFNRNRVDKINIPENSFIIQKKDSIHFSQIKGKLLWAYFKEDTLKKIDISGNAQAVYYLENEKKKLQGANLIESSRLCVLSVKGKPDRITFLKKPVAKIIPMKDVKSKEIEMKGFSWDEYKRPKSKSDLFVKKKKPAKP